MHSLSEFGANVPAFLAKLWKLVDDPETNELISWSEEGTSFCIRDQAQFSRKLLPMYYKHNNMASFIRQLNMYGFHKIVSADAGSLRLDRDEMEFAHQCFLRGHPYLLEHIKRKVGKSQLLTSKQIEEGKEGANGGVVVKAEFMNKVLSEVKSMRGRQDSVENRLTSMKQENEALWRELSLLRQKHIKQQTIVNKLIQFLVTLVQPSQRLKRRYPLMLNNAPHPSGNSNGKVHNLNPEDITSRSPSGTTIHELDPDSILPDGELILPDNDTESLASNTITLHVPGTELAEVIGTTLEPEILSADAEDLDCLDSSVIENPLSNSPSSVSLLEVNYEPGEQSEEALKASSPSPELMLAVRPSELAPAIVVPALQANKQKPAITIGHQTAAQKLNTRSTQASSQEVGSSKFMMTRKSAGSKASMTGNGVSSTQSMNVPIKEIKKEAVGSQSVGKREMRVLAPRNRKRKQTNGKDILFEGQNLENVGAPVDLLAEVGLVDTPSSSASAPSPGTLNHDATNGSPCGPVSSPCQLVAYPESPVPLIHSPVSSPASHCNLGQHIPMSPMSGPTITDITSPLVVQPCTGSSIQGQQSPQSTSETVSSPYDMTLACTSHGSSPPSGSTALKSSSSFNREDFDYHVGTMDTELGQLKEFLNSSGIQLDANTLLGLFNGDELSSLQEDGGNITNKADATGSELMYYQPDFLDLEDIWNNDNSRSTPPPSPIISSEVNTPVMMPSSPGFYSSSSKRRRN